MRKTSMNAHVRAAICVALAAGLMPNARAQEFRIGNRLIPPSSIERPEDFGRRAHTYLQILAGPDGRPQFAGGIGLGPDGGLGAGGGLSPAQLRQAYYLPSTGGSEIIALVDAYHDPNALADFNTFAAKYGLPQETSTVATASTNKVFQVLYASGSQPGVDATGSWEVEESLDIEWAHAMAPNAKILLVETASNSYFNLCDANAIAAGYTDGNGLTVKETSNSWGGREFGGETFYDMYYSGSNAVYFASAGDTGAPAQYPSASPYVISAGGTTLSTDSSGNFVSETGWNSGGGGPSIYESRPTFQNGISSIVGASRGTPDLSSVANPSTGASVYDSYPYNGHTYGWLVIGGTSWSSPTLAGIANLAATEEGLFPAGSQALLTTIYANLGTANFRDITIGNNHYAAMVGWDFVTGVGSCLGLGGLQQEASGPPPPAITSLSPSSATVGGASFTLTVNGTGFVSGSTVEWKGSALATTFVSSTQLTATVPAGDIASVGTAAVTVVNPGPVTSIAVTFTIGNVAPTLTSISPNSTVHGSGPVTVTLTGTGFIAGSKVQWYVSASKTTTALATIYVSPTQLTAVVPSSLLTMAGSATVSVLNPTPGGGASGGFTFTIQ